MRNHFLLIIIVSLLMLPVQSKTEVLENKDSDSISAYFTLPTNGCSSCQQGVINSYRINYFKEFNTKIIIVLKGADTGLARVLKKNTKVDSVIVSQTKGVFRNIKLQSSSDLLVFDSHNQLISQLPHYKLVGPPIVSPISMKQHIIKPDSLFLANVCYTFSNDIEQSIFLIDWQQMSIINYNYIDNKILNTIIPSKKDKYNFCPENKELRTQWDELFQYDKDFIEYLAILQLDTNKVKTFIGIENGRFRERILKKNNYDNYHIGIEFAIYEQEKHKESKIKLLANLENYRYEYDVRLKNNILNDSILIFPLYNSQTHKHRIGFFNNNLDSMYFIQKSDSIWNNCVSKPNVISIKDKFHSLFTSYGNNTIIFYNERLNKISGYKIQPDSANKVTLINSTENFISKAFQKQLISINSNENSLFFCYLLNNNHFYIEEYSNTSFTFIKGFSLEGNSSNYKYFYFTNDINDKIKIFVQTTAGEWELLSYEFPIID